MNFSTPTPVSIHTLTTIIITDASFHHTSIKTKQATNQIKSIMVTPANSSPTSAFGRTIPPDSGSADARKDRHIALAAQKQKKLDDAARKEADQNEKKERESRLPARKRKRWNA